MTPATLRAFDAIRDTLHEILLGWEGLTALVPLRRLDAALDDVRREIEREREEAGR